MEGWANYAQALVDVITIRDHHQLSDSLCRWTLPLPLNVSNGLGPLHLERIDFPGTDVESQQERDPSGASPNHCPAKRPILLISATS